LNIRQSNCQVAFLGLEHHEARIDEDKAASWQHYAEIEPSEEAAGISAQQVATGERREEKVRAQLEDRGISTFHESRPWNASLKIRR
jgi:hypothetical protein